MMPLLGVFVYIFVGGVVCGVVEAVETWPNRHTPTNRSSYKQTDYVGICLFWPVVVAYLVGCGGFKLAYNCFLKFESKGIF